MRNGDSEAAWGGEPVIWARSLVKRYGEFTAVAGVDFEVWPGECFGLLGPNGAGKSSAIRMLTGLSPTSGGELMVCGLDVARNPRQVKALVGVVPQEDNLDPDFRVRKNLEVHARYFGVQGRVARERALQALDLVRLRERQNDRVDTLSGGMKRRLLIARALMNDPPVLVLDEPTTGLDPQSRHLLWELLRSLKRQGITILLTTHYMEEAAHLCDRIVIMDNGRILVEGRPGELIGRHAGSEVLELRPPPERYEALLARLQALGFDAQDGGGALVVFGAEGAAIGVEATGELVESARRPTNLEDVFLRLTGRELRDE
ncbi:MAG: ABC transporter ATP-binding protein [Dehalococcoidia bacterium]|nr:ABC transporter ATP-binding protein [Dehalococcoidia bacterium]